MLNGYICLHKKLLEWGWFKDSNMVHLFVYLLLKANWKDNVWCGITIKRGEFVTGRHALHKETGISEQTVRTSLERLKSTNEITIKSTNKYSIITICNYDRYQNQENEINQPINQLPNQQLTSNQPATNQQLTTTEEYKKNKNKKDYSVGFLQFWSAYPKKVGKGSAWKEWQHEDPPLDICLKTLEWQKKSEDWIKEGGKYIVDPERWIKRRRWEDESPQTISVLSKPEEEEILPWNIKKEKNEPISQTVS